MMNVSRPLAGLRFLAGFAALILSQVISAQPQKIAYDIPAQSLESALTQFGVQSKRQLVFDPDTVPARTTPAVKGEYAPLEALDILIGNSGLTYSVDGKDTIIVRRITAASSVDSALRLVQSDTQEMKKVENSNSSESNSPSEPSAEGSENKEQEIEVVVTGTHIRGSEISAVRVYDRSAIDATGVGTVQDFINRLPQNFSDTNEATGLAVSSSLTNDISGTGVNLRGLGADSTLVLVNGRRVAPGNTFGNFVDVSMIPLSSLDRVEIITDGASAIYGSDAVGGVINFILRHDLDGAETRLRYGSVSQGDRDEVQAGQSVGGQWNDGFGLLSYEYLRASELNASERRYTNSVPGRFYLLPQQQRHSVFGTLTQRIRPGTEIFADASYGYRDMDSFTGGVDLAQEYRARISAPSGTVGARFDAFGSGQLELSTTYTASKTHRKILDFGANQADNEVDARVFSIDGKFDGTLLQLNSGAVRFALGGQFREEEYENEDLLSASNSLSLDRHLTAAFVEAHVPLIGASRHGSSEPQLLLTLADRYEHYSDFGSTNNPEAGLHWQPVPALSLHGTIGKSFKAPALSNLDPTPDFAFPVSTFDPLTNSTAPVLVVFGGNPDLKPEKADTWTISADLKPASVPGMKVHVGYYNIRFKDRIAFPADNIAGGFFDSLRFESLLGPAILQRNPPASVIDAFANGPNFFNPSNVDLAAITAFFDARRQNISAVKTSGLDFEVSYGIDFSADHLEVGVDGAYIEKFGTQVTERSAVQSILDKSYNPLHLKVRGRAVVVRNGLKFAAFVNYANAYENIVSGISQPVSSWTTLDATIGYEVGPQQGFLADTRFQIGILNITDKDPPFVLNPFDVHFDGDNANPLGRYYSAQIAKRL